MKNFLKLGDWNTICDSCGRKFKASSLRQRWDGLMVCNEDWETRHPQDFLRVQKERIAVPFSRPDVLTIFTASCTIVNSQAVAGLAVAGCMVAGKKSTASLI